MKVLAKSECAAWCERHGVPSFNGLPRIPIGERFEIPSDAGRRVALARERLGAFHSSYPLLIWFTEWGIWPSGEHQFMFDRFRASFGIEERLIDRPGHLIDAREEETALALLCFGVLFLWDVFLVTEGGRPMLFLSHDEYGVADGGAL